MTSQHEALARMTDPATSHEAAGRVDGKSLAAMVLAELKAGGAGTSHELAERMGLSLVTVSPRMRPLANAGKVIEDGKRSGRTVWKAVV
jgi:hypothetical protein